MRMDIDATIDEYLNNSGYDDASWDGNFSDISYDSDEDTTNKKKKTKPEDPGKAERKERARSKGILLS